MSTYFAILTKVGEAKLANAIALGTKLDLTQMAVGDGNGNLPMPSREQTALTHEVRRAAINQLSRDATNNSQIIVEQVLPENVGGWWIREIGIYDAAGDLCAVANCPPSYKPQLAEGSGRTQVVRVILIVASSTAIELKIDPSVVLATKKYADDKMIEVITLHEGKLNPHPQYMNQVEGEQSIAAAVTALTDKIAQKADLAGTENQTFKVGKATLPSHAINLGHADSRYMPASGGERIGEMVDWPYPSIKPNTLLCNGQAVSSTVYAALFAFAVKVKVGATIAMAAPTVVTWPNHPLYINAPIKFTSTGALPNGLVTGSTYYVIGGLNYGANTFQISATIGGPAIIASGAQSGVHTAIHAVHGCANDLSTFNLPNVPAGFATIQAANTEGTTTVGQVLEHNHTNVNYRGDLVGGGGSGALISNTYGSQYLINGGGGSANLAAGLAVRKCIYFA